MADDQGHQRQEEWRASFDILLIEIEKRWERQNSLQVAMLQGAITLGAGVLRAMTITSGGAIVVVLAFAGQIVTGGGTQQAAQNVIPTLAPALQSLFWALALSLVAAAGAYIFQYASAALYRPRRKARAAATGNFFVDKQNSAIWLTSAAPAGWTLGLLVPPVGLAVAAFWFFWNGATQALEAYRLLAEIRF